MGRNATVQLIEGTICACMQSCVCVFRQHVHYDLTLPDLLEHVVYRINPFSQHK